MITITETGIQLTDSIEYKAELRLVEVGYISKELLYHNRDVGEAILKLHTRLTSLILNRVYKDVIDKLDAVCQELLSDAKGKSFERYEANLEMAQRLRKLANELRSMNELYQIPEEKVVRDYE
jgi:hypothetical protein